MKWNNSKEVELFQQDFYLCNSFSIYLLCILYWQTKWNAKLNPSVAVKRELSQKAKLSNYKSIYVPTLPYGHELRVVTERMRMNTSGQNELPSEGGWAQPWRSDIREETPRRTKDTLEGLCISAGLGTSRWDVIFILSNIKFPTLSRTLLSIMMLKPNKPRWLIKKKLIRDINCLKSQ